MAVMRQLFLIAAVLAVWAVAQPNFEHAGSQEKERDTAGTAYVHRNDHTIEAASVIFVSSEDANTDAIIEKRSHPSHAASHTSAVQSSTSPAVSAPVSSSASPQSVSNGLGITYSPYLADGCKTKERVSQDLAALSGYSFIRIYGTDCSQVENVMASLPDNTKMLIGIFDITAASLQNEVDLIVQGVNGAWHSVEAITVGNEGVNDNAYSITAVSNAIATVRGMLATAGYSGPVATVDTFIAVINNPSMCDLSSTIYVNCHAYFDGNVVAQDAGAFVLEQAQRVSSICEGKTVVVTESGWPSQGSPNNKAIAGHNEQRDAIQSLRDKFESNLYLFTAYNDAEKPPGPFDIEPYFGIIG